MYRTDSKWREYIAARLKLVRDHGELTRDEKDAVLDAIDLIEALTDD